MNDEERQLTVRLMLKAAEDALNAGDMAVQDGQKPLLHLKIDPPFGNPRAWRIRVDADALAQERLSRGTAECVLWDRDYDYLDLKDGAVRLHPSVRRCRVPLDETAIQFLDERVTFPALDYSHPSGIDGTLYALTLSPLSGRVVLEWWESGPPEWAPLVTWAERLVRHLMIAARDAEPEEDTRANVKLLFDAWRDLLTPLPADITSGTAYDTNAIASFAAEMPTLTPVPYRRLLRQIGSFGAIMPDGRAFHLHPLDRVRELRADDEIPQQIDGQPMVPFASDERGVLLLELNESAGVWRCRDQVAERVAPTLAQYFARLLREWQRAYGVDVW